MISDDIAKAITRALRSKRMNINVAARNFHEELGISYWTARVQIGDLANYGKTTFSDRQRHPEKDGQKAIILLEELGVHDEDFFTKIRQDYGITTDSLEDRKREAEGQLTRIVAKLEKIGKLTKTSEAREYRDVIISINNYRTFLQK